MENNIETVEDVKIDGTGENKVATETEVEVEMISKKEAQKMVNSALAKKLPPKEEMDAFKQWKESQKTEADKQAERELEHEKTKNKVTILEQKLAVADADVLKEFRSYVMFEVSQMDGEFEDNLVEFLKENPKFTAKEEKSVASTTGVKNSGVDNKDSGVTAILKAKHPELFND